MIALQQWLFFSIFSRCANDNARGEKGGTSYKITSQQKRTCKIMQESCKNLACKTCLARAHDMSLFLHNLARFLPEMVQDFARDAARIITCKCGVSCTFLQNLARIGARLCKKRDISRARAKQVLHARFLQDSCMILQVRFCWVVSWNY